MIDLGLTHVFYISLSDQTVQTVITIALILAITRIAVALIERK